MAESERDLEGRTSPERSDRAGEEDDVGDHAGIGRHRGLGQPGATVPTWSHQGGGMAPPLPHAEVGEPAQQALAFAGEIFGEADAGVDD